MRAIPTDRHSTPAGVALAVALVVILGACTKTAEIASPPASGTVAASTSTTAPGAKPASASPAAAACSAAVLEPILKAKFAGAGLADLACSAEAAVATTTGPGTPAGGGVAFFMVKEGAWALVADGPAGDADRLRPTGLSSLLLASWKDKRTPAASPNAPADPKGDGTYSLDSTCHYEGDNKICPTTTQPPTTMPTTVPTTRPTTTEPPPAAPPPTNPTTTLSEFCRTRPLDPSCLPPR